MVTLISVVGQQAESDTVAVAICAVVVTLQWDLDFVMVAAGTKRDCTFLGASSALPSGRLAAHLAIAGAVRAVSFVAKKSKYHQAMISAADAERLAAAACASSDLYSIQFIYLSTNKSK